MRGSIYDATSPSILTETIDMDYAFWGNRFGEGSDYLNVPLSKEEYYWFVEQLLNAREAHRHDLTSRCVFRAVPAC